MKHNPKGITTAMQLYFSGESLRNVAHSLKLIGMDVGHQTIYNWIDKYTSLMEKYLDKITPKISTAWRTDELYLKVKGNTKYLYALMDDEIHFWIAQKYDYYKIFRIDTIQMVRIVLWININSSDDFLQFYLFVYPTTTLQNLIIKHLNKN